MKSQVKKKVFVGLSGGVDSSVSAALLKKEGYDVTGVFIKAWNPPGFICTWREDRRSAMRAAAVLDIPFITLDLENEYKTQVVDYMIREYKEGKTPNPDVMCNKEIKFGLFLKFALENGADFVATGHYARTSPRPRKLGLPLSLSRRGATRSEGGGVLMEGEDKNKDQSYFLWTLTKEQLAHVLFPVGHLQKEEVRKLAAKFELPQSTRKDSQGLCFLGKIDMKEFLKEYVGSEKGSVLNESGEIIGEHDGAVLYTLGERHGFRVFNEKNESEPLYVVAKNIAENTIVVAQKSSLAKSLASTASEDTEAVRGDPRTFQKRSFSEQNSPKHFSEKLIELREINWISGKEPEEKNIECRYRYRQQKIKCRISGNRVEFEEAQDAVSAGQSIVFYQGEKCLGGAIIS